MIPFGLVARRYLLSPFERFFRLEAAGSLVLMGAALVALAWANSPWGATYEALWHAKGVIGLGPLVLEKDVLHWVNDGLMALFFLLVGLEIKREFLTGQLRNLRAAVLPVAAAIGGMIVPALLYLALNSGTDAQPGWGIPMATDIAFALGALALLGRRAPTSLRVFLAAAAIVDDLGAVLVIALFYTPSVSLGALAVAAAVLMLLVILNRSGVNHPAPYILLGVLLWLAVLKSGVHATIAGVLLAFTIPARVPATVAAGAGHAAGAGAEGSDVEARQAQLVVAEQTAEAQQSTLTRLEHTLAPWVAFAIMPVFAFANAGVALTGNVLDAILHPVSLGILLGLVVGKQIGVFVTSWLSVRTGIATIPEGASWPQVYAVSWLAGIGFTMSLFIAGLGLPPELQMNAKLGILAASLVAGIGGILILLAANRRATPSQAPA